MRTLIVAVAAVLFFSLSFAGEPETPLRCPLCSRSDSIRPIVYGYPGEDMRWEAERGEVILGGCCISDDMPLRGCLFCDRIIEPFLWNIAEKCRWSKQLQQRFRGGIRMTADSWPVFAPESEKNRMNRFSGIRNEVILAANDESLQLAVSWSGHEDGGKPERIFLEIPLASMSQIFPDDQAADIAELNPPLSFYFSAPNEQAYRELAQELGLILRPPPGCENLKFRLLAMPDLKTAFAEYIRLNEALAVPDSGLDPAVREYFRLITAIYKSDINSEMGSIIIDIIKQRSEHKGMDWIKNEAVSGFIGSWNSKGLKLKLTAAHSGLFRNVPFCSECELGGGFSLYAFFNSGANMADLFKMWEEIRRNMTGAIGGA